MQIASCLSGVSSHGLPYAVPVVDGFIVRHGKKLVAGAATFVMAHRAEVRQDENVCLHNGTSSKGLKTAYHMDYYKGDEDHQVCKELCGYACHNNKI
jgi:hypothetical protein